MVTGPPGRDVWIDMGGPVDRSSIFARGTREQLPFAGEEPGRDLECATDPAFEVAGRGVIRNVNRHAERMLGTSRAELVGEMIESVLVCEDPSVLETPAQGVRFAPAGTVQTVTAGGDRLMSALTVCASEEDRRVILVRVLGRERSSLDEDDLAAIVHDLRGPLSAIALETHLLGDRAGGAETVARIERNTSYMDRLVSDLLDLCAADAGKLQLDERPIELGELVMRVLQRLAAVDARRVHVDRPRSSIATCDERRIERVLANLVDNALKYSPPECPVIVRVRSSVGGTKVTVIDEGCGLAPSDLEAVFHKYHRAPTALRSSGSGLGLYVCRRIIEEHGGRFHVTSEGDPDRASSSSCRPRRLERFRPRSAHRNPRPTLAC